MIRYSRSHLSDPTLKRSLATNLARERAGKAEVCAAKAEALADLGEFEARRLYLPAAYSTMHDFCVGELGLTKESAYKRIRAARAARMYPVIFDAVADGRLRLSGIVVLASHLTAETVKELVAAAAHKSKAEIERLMAARGVCHGRSILSPGTIGNSEPADDPGLSPGTNGPSPDPAEPESRPGLALTPPSPAGLHFNITGVTVDKLRYLQALLGHQAWSRDVAQVVDRAFDAYIVKVEKTKFAATSCPRPGRRRSSADTRHIPAEVRRAVWQRDSGRCTFVSERGRRCESRTRLEFDHVVEVARGGMATVDGIRIRCRAHNQYTAECTFGKAFMQAKRDQSRRAAEAKRAKAEARAKRDRTSDDPERDVTPWLRQLGFRADEARRAAEHCKCMPEASLEERVKAALRFLTPAHRLPRKVILPVGTRSSREAPGLPMAG